MSKAGLSVVETIFLNWRKNKMRLNVRKIKAGLTLIGLMLLPLVLVSCTIKEPTKPKEPNHIEYGMAGEQPIEVTNSYDWTCFDNNFYREIKK
jgi:hypothetical protein